VVRRCHGLVRALCSHCARIVLAWCSHWACIGLALGLHWACIGLALGSHWARFGLAWGSHGGGRDGAERESAGAGETALGGMVLGRERQRWEKGRWGGREGAGARIGLASGLHSMGSQGGKWCWGGRGGAGVGEMVLKRERQCWRRRVAPELTEVGEMVLGWEKRCWGRRAAFEKLLPPPPFHYTTCSCSPSSPCLRSDCHSPT